MTRGLVIAGALLDRREDAGARWRYGKAYPLGGGYVEYVVHGKPLHYKDGSDWKPIRPEWDRSDRAGFAWQMVENDYQCWIADDLQAVPFAVIRRAGLERAYRLGDAVWSLGNLGQSLGKVPAGRLALLNKGAAGLPHFLARGVTLKIVPDNGGLILRAEVPAEARPKLPTWRQGLADDLPELMVQMVPVGAGLWAATDYYGGTADGEIYGTAGNYATAHGTSTGMQDTNDSARVGQKLAAGTYSVYRGYLTFDTSGIGSGKRVTAATIYICSAWPDFSDTEFDVKVYRYAWTDPLDTDREANYDGAYGGSATLEGILCNTSAGWNDGDYHSMALAKDGINMVGNSRYTVVSGLDVAGTPPAGNEYVYMYNAENWGTDKDPYLTATAVSISFGMFV